MSKFVYRNSIKEKNLKWKNTNIGWVKILATGLFMYALIGACSMADTSTGTSRGKTSQTPKTATKRGIAVPKEKRAIHIKHVKPKPTPNLANQQVQQNKPIQIKSSPKKYFLMATLSGYYNTLHPAANLSVGQMFLYPWLIKDTNQNIYMDGAINLYTENAVLMNIGAGWRYTFTDSKSYDIMLSKTHFVDLGIKFMLFDNFRTRQKEQQIGFLENPLLTMGTLLYEFNSNGILLRAALPINTPVGKGYFNVYEEYEFLYIKRFWKMNAYVGGGMKYFGKEVFGGPEGGVQYGIPSEYNLYHLFSFDVGYDNIVGLRVALSYGLSIQSLWSMFPHPFIPLDNIGRQA